MQHSHAPSTRRSWTLQASPAFSKTSCVLAPSPKYAQHAAGLLPVQGVKTVFLEAAANVMVKVGPYHHLRRQCHGQG